MRLPRLRDHAHSPVSALRRRLILVRHGAVDRERADPPIKPGAFYGGNVDVPLSKLGEEEAIAAARLIAAEQRGVVQAIWSSPMRRAVFGARAIGTAIAAAGEEWTPPMPVDTFEAFREIDRGPVGIGWTDLTPEEIEARDGPNAVERCATEQTLGAWKAVNGGEGFCDLRARVLGERDALLRTLPLGAAGVLVSHMWVTRAIVGEARPHRCHESASLASPWSGGGSGSSGHVPPATPPLSSPRPRPHLVLLLLLLLLRLQLVLLRPLLFLLVLPPAALFQEASRARESTSGRLTEPSRRYFAHLRRLASPTRCVSRFRRHRSRS